MPVVEALCFTRIGDEHLLRALWARRGRGAKQDGAEDLQNFIRDAGPIGFG